MNDVAGRARWLGSPVFLVATAVLLLNDHVFKERFGGVVTGKLSDVAGVVVVGVLAAVVLDVRRGMVLTAVSFSALKVVPGVAEAVAPVLGGVTRRDVTDLIAVAVLVPLGLHLARSERAISRAGTAVRVVVSSALPVLGASVALVATTATSCAPDPAIVQIIPSAEGVVVARVSDDHSRDTFLSSDDGGQTWTAAEAPSGVAGADAGALAPTSYGPLRVCTDGDWCLELEDERRIVRIDPDGRRTVEFELSDEDIREISGRCTGSRIGMLTSISLVRPDGDEAVASLGQGGVVTRGDEGEWERVEVFAGDAGFQEVLGTSRWLVLGFGPLLLASVWLAGRARLPSRGLALVVAACGWFGLVILFGALTLTGPIPTLAGYFVLVGAAAAVVAVTILTGRRRVTPPPPTWWYPPPPPSGPWNFPPPPPPPPAAP